MAIKMVEISNTNLQILKINFLGNLLISAQSKFMDEFVQYFCQQFQIFQIFQKFKLLINHVFSEQKITSIKYNNMKNFSKLTSFMCILIRLCRLCYRINNEKNLDVRLQKNEEKMPYFYHLFPVLPEKNSQMMCRNSNKKVILYAIIFTHYLFKTPNILIQFFQKMHLFIIALLCSALYAGTFDVHEVIIIGAGTSGISASKILNQHHIEHVILEGRDRIGGRIFSSDLDGQQIDLGATFVHNPGPKNSISNLINEMKMPTIPAKGYKIQQFSLNRYHLNQSENEALNNGIKDLQNFIYYLTKQQDTNLESAWQSFKEKKGQEYSNQVLTRLHYKLSMQGSLNGADLKQKSARRYVRNRQQNAQDIIVVGGYESLLKALYEKCCKKTKIYFNHFVTEIDYSGDVIKVTTSDNKHFYCKKIIVSVPLGVLKKQVIAFKPRLPSFYRSAISKIGFGVFNKIIVTFQERFWRQDKKILNFVAKQDKKIKYQQCYVVTATPQVNLVMFLVAGHKSLQINKMKDSKIAQDLARSLKQFISFPVKINNITVTKWQQDKYSYGSYSYYQVGTSRRHFQIMKTPISKKLWFVGEHAHPQYSSNVHGAFDSGRDAALEIVKSFSLSRASYKQSEQYGGQLSKKLKKQSSE